MELLCQNDPGSFNKCRFLGPLVESDNLWVAPGNLQVCQMILNIYKIWGKMFPQHLLPSVAPSPSVCAVGLLDPRQDLTFSFILFHFVRWCIASAYQNLLNSLLCNIGLHDNYTGFKTKNLNVTAPGISLHTDTNYSQAITNKVIPYHHLPPTR